MFFLRALLSAAILTAAFSGYLMAMSDMQSKQAIKETSNKADEKAPNIKPSHNPMIKKGKDVEDATAIDSNPHLGAQSPRICPVINAIGEISDSLKNPEKSMNLRQHEFSLTINSKTYTINDSAYKFLLGLPTDAKVKFIKEDTSKNKKTMCLFEVFRPGNASSIPIALFYTPPVPIRN